MLSSEQTKTSSQSFALPAQSPKSKVQSPKSKVQSPKYCADWQFSYHKSRSPSENSIPSQKVFLVRRSMFAFVVTR